ncbi:MAG TPA: amino acid ABC transporter substrate-binding protein [Burkholderiales bacterium]|nr:amino acid ABC transporter substrate-binding protein [Burkholderiales bacterium]
MRRQFLIAAAALLAALPAFAAGEDTLTIGFTVSQTGALNLDSLAQQHGFEMWRDEVNAAGGIKAGGKRYQVRFVTYDDQSQGGRVQQLYTRLIVQDHAQFLFSPYSSGLVATATVISEQYGKLMMSIGGAEGKTYQLGNHYLFQTYTPADHYLSGAIELLKDKDPGAKIALVYSDDPFSKAVATATRDQAKQAGLAIVMDESYPPSQTDFSAIINKVVASGADALLGGGHYPDGATLARQLYDQKAKLKWATLLVAPDSPQFASLGPAAQGISVPSQWAPQVTYKPDFGPTPAEFTKRFQAKYNMAPGYHAAGGYAGGLLFQRAIERADSIDPAKVAAELNQMKATTLWGGTQFSTDPKSHGLQLAHQMVLTQWQMQGGKLVKEVIWPTSAATAKIAFPYR